MNDKELKTVIADIQQNIHNSTFENKIALTGIAADEVLKVIDYPSVFRLLQIPMVSAIY